MTPWLLALHVLGLAMWVGGLLSAAIAVGPGPAAARKLMRAVADPGAGLALTAGLWMLSADAGGYFAQAWFQTKMVVAVGLIGLHGAVAVRTKRAASSEVASGPAWGLFFAVLAAAAAMIFLSLPGRMMW